MEVPEQQLRHSYQEHSSKGNWYVNSRADLLKVSVRVEGVSADDLDRLYVRHASACTFKAHFETNSGPLDQTYQEALELGRRVVKEIREPVNLVLRFIRDNYGQHWLRLLSDDDEEQLQNFLDDVRAEWREDTNPWKRLLVTPRVIAIRGVYLRAANLYLEIVDWEAIQQAVVRNERPSDGFTLLSDSRERYYQGDTRVAIIHLNSALEWAVQRFLHDQLGSKIPSKSLEELLKQSHGRLLDDWVLPLDRDLGLGLEQNEWPSVKRIQKLRREAGHPTLVSEINNLTNMDFHWLAKHATSAVAKLSGQTVPKTPPPMDAIIAGGTV
jgi:hypothetical protein